MSREHVVCAADNGLFLHERLLDVSINVEASGA